MIRRLPLVLPIALMVLALACSPPAAAPAKPAAEATKPAVSAGPAASPAAASSPAAVTSPVAGASPAAASSPAAAPTSVPAAPAPQPAAPAKPVGTARVAFFDVVYNAPVYVAHEQGLWKQQGLEVELVQTRAGNLAQVALSTGQADFAVAGIDSLMAMRDQGGRDVVAIWNLLNRLTLNVVLDKDVAAEKGVTRQSPLEQRYAALKGLTFGITAPGAVSDVYLRYYLRQTGADPDRDANFVAIGDATALLAALKTKQIQGYMLSAPTPQFAEQQDFGTILIKSSEGDVPEFADFQYVFYAGLRDYMDKNPEITRAFVTGLDQAREFVLDPKNRSAVTTVMQKYFSSMSDDVLQLSIDDTLPSISKDSKFNEATLVRTLGILADTNQVKPELKGQPSGDGTWWTNRYHP